MTAKKQARRASVSIEESGFLPIKLLCKGIAFDLLCLLCIVQVAALQSSGLLGGMGSAGMPRNRRGMSTPDLTQLPHNMQVSSMPHS